MFFFFLCLWITQKYKYGFDILNNSNCVPTTFYNIWFGNKKKLLQIWADKSTTWHLGITVTHINIFTTFHGELGFIVVETRSEGSKMVALGLHSPFDARAQAVLVLPFTYWSLVVWKRDEKFIQTSLTAIDSLGYNTIFKFFNRSLAFAMTNCFL